MKKVAICRFSRSSEGITLIELVVVLCLCGILLAIALPSLADLSADLDVRKATRDIVSLLRDGRNRAISANFEHQVEFDAANNRCRLTRGNRSSNSTTWNTVVCDWIDLPSDVRFTANSGGTIQFNTNGTSDAGTITLYDNDNVKRFYVRIAAGRIRTEQAH